MIRLSFFVWMFLIFISLDVFCIEKNGKITGKVIDDTKKPVDLANVTITDIKTNKVIKFSSTNQEGYFELNQIPEGEYFISVLSLDHKTLKLKETILINQQNTDIKIPTIILETQINSLDEMVVVGESTSIVNKIDRKIVNVGKDLNIVGADASFVMSNIPSVSVDSEGGISLRGNSNVVILIDGKMTNLDADDLLKTIPADAISQVEIITNPSSKYNPEGSSGIINIITKREKMGGFNGNINSSIGTKDKYSIGTNININSEKIAFSTNYNFRDFRMERDIDLERKIIKYDRYNLTDKFGFGKDKNHTLKTNIDYFIDKEQRISYGLDLSFINRYNLEDINYLFLNSNKIDTLNMSNRNSKDISDRFSHNHNLNYKNEFGRKDHYLEFDINASFRKDNANGNYENVDSLISIKKQYSDKNISNSKNEMINISLDYSNVLEGKQKIETGIRTTFRNLSTVQEYQTLLLDTYQKVPSRSSDFSYEESVYAIYGIYADELEGLFDYQLGLRVENTKTKVKSVTLDSTNVNNYWSFFPTLHLVKALNENNELSVNFSRRISRPRGHFLDPTPIYSDQLNVRVGNPYLRPQFTNSIELGHLYNFGTGSLLTSIFSRFNEDVVNRIFSINNKNENIITFGNVGRSKEYGAEMTFQNKMYKIWTTMIMANIYLIDIKGTSDDFTNTGVHYSLRFNNSFILPSNFSFQINYFFHGPDPMPQGFRKEFHRVDMSLQKSFFDKELNLGLRVSDIFNTVKMVVNSNQSQFIDYNVLKFETQMLFLTASYSFGSSEKNNKKSKRKKDGNESDNNNENEF